MSHDSARPGAPRDLMLQRREAIDLIATLRARAVRVALFGLMLNRPVTDLQNTPVTDAECLDLVAEQVAVMARVRQVLTGCDPAGAIPAPILRWIADAAMQDGAIVPVIDQIHRLSEDVLAAAHAARQQNSRGSDALGAALLAHFRFGRGEFFNAVTSFCDLLWQSLDHERNADLDRTRHAGQAISRTLDRLERIGKHVRLVSLNASVEASRAGDAGKGLGVIATEFKTLAEEIQNLAVTAQTEIDQL